MKVYISVVTHLDVTDAQAEATVVVEAVLARTRHEALDYAVAVSRERFNGDATCDAYPVPTAFIRQAAGSRPRRTDVSA